MTAQHFVFYWVTLFKFLAWDDRSRIDPSGREDPVSMGLPCRINRLRDVHPYSLPQMPMKERQRKGAWRLIRATAFFLICI
jgi:hypothetical protein